MLDAVGQLGNSLRIIVRETTFPVVWVYSRQNPERQESGRK